MVFDDDTTAVMSPPSPFLPILPRKVMTLRRRPRRATALVPETEDQQHHGKIKTILLTWQSFCGQSKSIQDVCRY